MRSVYPVWTGTEWVDIIVPQSEGEPVVVPTVRAVVYRASDRGRILLQRRDKPAEAAQGRLELPGGKWRAGESVDEAVKREVQEETGVTVRTFVSPVDRKQLEKHVSFGVAQPSMVVTGLEGAYPAAHFLVECIGEGNPRPLAGATVEPAWWELSAVRTHLADEPHDFVRYARVALAVYFDG